MCQQVSWTCLQKPSGLVWLKSLRIIIICYRMQLENINKVLTYQERIWRPPCCRPSITSTRWPGQRTCSSGSSCPVGHSSGQGDSYSSILCLTCNHEQHYSEIQICSLNLTLLIQQFLTPSGEDCDVGTNNVPLWFVIKPVCHEKSLSCWWGVPDIRFQHLDRHSESDKPVLLWLDKFNVVDNSFINIQLSYLSKCKLWKKLLSGNLPRLVIATCPGWLLPTQYERSSMPTVRVWGN